MVCGPVSLTGRTNCWNLRRGGLYLSETLETKDPYLRRHVLTFQDSRLSIMAKWIRYLVPAATNMEFIEQNRHPSNMNYDNFEVTSQHRRNLTPLVSEHLRLARGTQAEV